MFSHLLQTVNKVFSTKSYFFMEKKRFLIMFDSFSCSPLITRKVYRMASEKKFWHQDSVSASRRAFLPELPDDDLKTIIDPKVKQHLSLLTRDTLAKDIKILNSIVLFELSGDKGKYTELAKLYNDPTQLNIAGSQIQAARELMLECIDNQVRSVASVAGKNLSTLGWNKEKAEQKINAHENKRFTESDTPPPQQLTEQQRKLSSEFRNVVAEGLRSGGREK